MARSKQDTTVRLVFANDIGCCGGGENRILSNDEFLHPVSRPDLQDSLNGLWREVTTIASDDERRTVSLDGIEYSLNKVLSVMLRRIVSFLRTIAVEHRVPPAGTPSPFGMLISMYIMVIDLVYTSF